MNSPIALDEQGHILVNDSMSDELKEKIALYNQLGDTEILEEELTDDDIALDESDEIIEDSDGSVAFESNDSLDSDSTEEVSDEELKSLNNLFD